MTVAVSTLSVVLGLLVLVMVATLVKLRTHLGAETQRITAIEHRLTQLEEELGVKS